MSAERARVRDARGTGVPLLRLSPASRDNERQHVGSARETKHSRDKLRARPLAPRAFAAVRHATHLRDQGGIKDDVYAIFGELFQDL